MKYGDVHKKKIYSRHYVFLNFIFFCECITVIITITIIIIIVIVIFRF
jgi:hypothetical protein